MALEFGSRRAVLPPTGSEPADRVAEPKEMPVTLGNGGCKVRRVPGGVNGNRRHALEDCVQPRHAATADVHLAQEQIGEHAQQREHANDHHPCDSGSRVAMGPKQDPRDDRQLEQRDECDSEQRVVERCDHGEQGVGCEQGRSCSAFHSVGQVNTQPVPKFGCGA